MKTIQQFLAEAKQSLATVSPDDRIIHALGVLEQRNLSSVLVVDNGKLLGIFSERDYARKVVLRGKTSKETPIKEVMTTNVITVAPTQHIGECMEIMTNRRVRHLPVLSAGGALIGIVSIGDVVKEIMADQRFTIDELQRYIAG